MECVKQLDLAKLTVRNVNDFLHNQLSGIQHSNGFERIEILNPNGMHSIAVGLDAPVDVDIFGHAGYFIAGMNKQANVVVHGNVGWSVAENIMSGSVYVKGHASECVGASAQGGLVVVEGDASSRCGISLKGGEIVIGGSVGHCAAFMAQAGTIVVCGDAGAYLGDSLYEATIYVRGKIHSLGSDAQEKEMQDQDFAKVAGLLLAANMDFDSKNFQRVVSARTLYHWNADEYQQY